MMLDNACIHKTAKALQAFQDKGYVVHFLPAYSPQYAPIELVFGRLKQAYYKCRLQDSSSQRPIPREVDDLVVMLCTSELVKRCFEHVSRTQTVGLDPNDLLNLASELID